MKDGPAGTVTMLFSDIEDSTLALLALGPDRWEQVLEVHSQIIRAALALHGGTEVRTEGDSFFAVFTSPTAAIAAVVAMQRELAAATWPEGGSVRVRMGLHTGEARPASEAAGVDYIGFEVHRAARIMAAGYGGQVLVSDTTAPLVRDSLPPDLTLRELGEHRFKDLVRPQQLFQLVIAGLPQEFPPLRTLDATSNNLPTQLTSFVGRQAQLENGLTLLKTRRLVTLTGSGGTGKTRLALHLAADALAGYRDGAWLVELAPISDPAAVAPAVAAALRIAERAGETTTNALVAGLRGRSLLVVLDNCEHLIMACAQLVDALLRSCPELTVLATSREGLNVPGEALMPVPSLSVPDDDSLPDLDALRQYEAVRLFVDRTATYQPDFVLTLEIAADVVRICRRLDGIPLALELAAARVRALSVAQVAQRLDDRFRLLTGGGRTVAARQQTLRALIDWSYDLLAEPEQQLLRRLSVFAGGWSLEAAEGVCAGDGLERDGILDLLAHLIDKSLVAVDKRVGVARYRMLETVRDYTREKLFDAGEAPATRQRHADHFLQLAVEQAVRPLEGPMFARVGLEYEDFRLALEWIEAEPDCGERRLLLVGSMLGAASARGRINELRRKLDEALALSDPSARTPGRARALLAAAQSAAMQSDYRTATRLLPQALELLRGLGSKRELAQVLMIVSSFAPGEAARAAADREARAIIDETGDTSGLALLEFLNGEGAFGRGDYAAARAGTQRGLELFRSIGDELMASQPLLSLGRLACIDGDYARARALVEESLAIRRREGPDDHWRMAIALISLGEVGRCAGDAAAAAPLFEEGLRHGREMGDDSTVAWSLHNLGHVALAAGDLSPAAARFREGVAIRRLAGPSTDVARGLAGLASVALRAGDLALAARLFGATEAILRASGAVLAPCDEQVRRSDIALARASLDPEGFAMALAEGESADPDALDAMAAAVVDDAAAFKG